MFEKFLDYSPRLAQPGIGHEQLAGLLNKNEIILTDQERRNLMFHIEGLTHPSWVCLKTC
jgi:hypothetical protein